MHTPVLALVLVFLTILLIVVLSFLTCQLSIFRKSNLLHKRFPQQISSVVVVATLDLGINAFHNDSARTSISKGFQ